MATTSPRSALRAIKPFRAAGTVAALVLVALVAAVLVASRVGGLVGLSTTVADARFAVASRPPVTRTVLVAIDPESLDAVDVWPWPRRVHARLIERLAALGAAAIHFDVDFSSPSNPADDAALERALRDSPVPVALAAHAQATGSGMAERLPLPRFAAHATVASVTVRAGRDGLIRHAERGRLLGGAPTPSLVSVLAGLPPAPDAFPIDYSIEPGGVPRVSVAAILDGTAEPEWFQDANVVIGATAVELGDILAVPRHGLLPGALVQVLAAETLAQGRVAVPLPRAALWGPLAALGFGLALIAAMHRGLVGFGPAVSSVAAALAALVTLDAALFARWALALPSVEIGLGLLAALAACVLHEIARRRGEAADEAARAENARRVLDRVVADNFDGIIVMAEDGTVLRASAVARQLSADLYGTDLSDGTIDALPATLREHLLRPARLLREGRWRAQGTMEDRARDRAGRDRRLEYVLTPSHTSFVEGGRSVIVTLTMRDVTEREAARERMEWLARHDEPSGALKPEALAAMLDEAGDARRGGGASPDGDARLDADARTGSLVAFDLRRFDVVRRTLGRAKADALLARAVDAVGREPGIRAVARLGDGDFVAWVEAEEAEAAERVRAAVRGAMGRADASATRMAVPAGTLALRDHSLAREALEAATVARERAVALGDAVVPHEPAMSAAAGRRLVQEADLPAAIARERLSVHYQPKIDLATGRPVGVEALVRWIHPDLGFVPPDEFVAVAEASGRIAELGAFVIERACHDALAIAAVAGPLQMGVNVSPQQFLQSDVSGMVSRALERTGLAPGMLELEITESLAVKDPALVCEALGPWRERGVSVALDDFGTGYAQLGMLRELPLDWIKLDRSLIAPLPAAESTSLVAAALTIARGHGLRAVAEGIEDERTAALLRGAGCHVGQGYHWSRPLPLERLVEWLAELLAERGAPAPLAPSLSASVPEVTHPC